jgi:hypothetical protein
MDGLPDRESRSLARRAELTGQELYSVTHGDFWIPDAEREIYKRGLRALNDAGVPYVVAGAYAIYEHTGIYRETKDLDVFMEPEVVEQAMDALRGRGFSTRLEQPHWLAKARMGEYFIDIIFGMGNGLALIDEGWYRHSAQAILAATRVRVAPAEELLWHRLFIFERHRQDMADIVHLILKVGHRLDWDRILDRTGEHWPMLLSQLHLFSYIYPESRELVPQRVMRELLSRAERQLEEPPTTERITRGTLISRFSFAIDVNEWGFEDVRASSVQRMERRPVIQRLLASDVWDERSRAAEELSARAD